MSAQAPEAASPAVAPAAAPAPSRPPLIPETAIEPYFFWRTGRSVTWWLASVRDALYSAAGAPIAHIPAGAPSRHVGHEVDVQATRAITPHLQVAGGYAYLRPGAFLKAATPGASYSSAFLMVTYVFLAEN